MLPVVILIIMIKYIRVSVPYVLNPTPRLMKGLFQLTILTAIALYITSLFAPGLVVSGNYISFILAGFTFVIASAVLKPLLSIVAFPFAFLSSAIVLVLSNAFSLYITALIFKNVKIGAFTLSTRSILGDAGKSFEVSNLLSYVVISVIIALIVKLFEWIFDLN